MPESMLSPGSASFRLSRPFGWMVGWLFLLSAMTPMPGAGRAADTLVASVGGPSAPLKVTAEPVAGPTGLPQALSVEAFSELKKSSPFQRSLNLSDSLILTGLAKFEKVIVATLLNKETKETYVVTDEPNPQGWKMVGVSEDDDLENVTAKVSISEGTVVNVRFDEARLKPGESRPASGPGTDQGGSRFAGGERRHEGHSGFGPPPEVMEKLRNMSDEQRERMREYMKKSFEKNPEMTPEQRREVFGKAVDKALRKSE